MNAVTTIPVRSKRMWWLRAVIGALVLVTAAWATTAWLNDSSRLTVTAVFADSSPLVPGNNVQLHGVAVGTISSITLVDGHAQVRMSLDRSVLPLHTDATATIQPVSLLGERFIALTQGSDTAPALSAPLTIPISGTSSSVDLDQLLNTLDDPTSTALVATVSTLGEGIAGQGDTVARALAGLAPALRQTDQLSSLLDQQNAVLDDFIVSVRANARAAAGPMDSLVDSATRTLGVVAANRAAVNDALTELPTTLASSRRALSELADTSVRTSDMLADLRPLTSNLDATSSELERFAAAAGPALSAMPDVLDRLNHLLDEARPVVRELGPASADLRTVGSAVDTLGRQVLTHRPGVPSQLENLLTGMGDWAMATSGHDGLTHYFRAAVVATPSSLARSGLGALPAVGAQPVNPVGPDANGKSGYPGTAPLPFLAPLPNPDGKDNSSHTAPGRNGLTPKQEHDMFDSLLGGG
ncbi:MlaD family protein [Pseudonocardia spinosispora]|uniref:MlaD family protein n=1 Tax=Pseudonocardia spinosispora TaxID=103441 RepID=UPI000411550F|nr:MlaD family protein [Pseudonocardia spinosispora]